MKLKNLHLNNIIFCVFFSFCFHFLFIYMILKTKIHHLVVHYSHMFYLVQKQWSSKNWLQKWGAFRSSHSKLICWIFAPKESWNFSWKISFLAPYFNEVTRQSLQLYWNRAPMCFPWNFSEQLSIRHLQILAYNHIRFFAKIW